ncbi:hypothetical protein DXG01_011355, partial [Tephrocybe rancida]
DEGFYEEENDGNVYPSHEPLAEFIIYAHPTELLTYDNTLQCADNKAIHAPVDTICDSLGHLSVTTPLADSDDFFDDPDYPFDPNFDWNRMYTWDEVHPCYRDPLPADTTIKIPSHMDVADQLSMPPPSQDITVEPCPPHHIDNAP